MDYLNRFLEKLGYFDIINDENRFEDFVQGLTVDQFSNILVTFNSKLRELSRKEKGFNKEGYMMAGGWYSPSVEVNKELLPILLDSVKKTDNNHDRACLLYYSLLQMHCFSDGNGRTSRLMYDLVNNSYDYTGEDNYYFHDDANLKKYTKPFTTARNIMDIDTFDYYSTTTLVSVLDRYGVSLDDRMKNKSITTYGSGMVGDTSLDVLNERRNYLSLSERDIIAVNLLDESGYYSLGGLIMTIIATKKGNIDSWIKKNDESVENLLKNNIADDDELIENRKNTFIFSLDSNKELFNNWTNGDFKSVITIGDDIKKQQIINTMRVFTDDNFCIINDKPLKELINTTSEAKKIAC